MSYCRWSSDDFQCDVYCYESERGIEIHVAATRPFLDRELPPPVPFSIERFDEWMARDGVVREWLARAEHKPIGLPHDGCSFCEADPGAAADLLQALRGMGYNVPPHVIDALREEASSDAES